MFVMQCDVAHCFPAAEAAPKNKPLPKPQTTKPQELGTKKPAQVAPNTAAKDAAGRNLLQWGWSGSQAQAQAQAQSGGWGGWGGSGAQAQAQAQSQSSKCSTERGRLLFAWTLSFLQY